MSNLLQEIEAQIAGVKTSVNKQNVGTVRSAGAATAEPATGNDGLRVEEAPSAAAEI